MSKKLIQEQLACVQTLLTKLKMVEKVESAKPSRFSCSQVPQNQGTEFDWLREFQFFFQFSKWHLRPEAKVNVIRIIE